MSDPFVAAYQRLKTFVAEGHTHQEVTEFAQQLNREFPQDNDIATAMIKLRAIGAIVRDLNGEKMMNKTDLYALDITGAEWAKSSFSEGEYDLCAEVSFLYDGAVALRDSTSRGHPEFLCRCRSCRR
jgi:hypothetical protein